MIAISSLPWTGAEARGSAWYVHVAFRIMLPKNRQAGKSPVADDVTPVREEIIRAVLTPKRPIRVVLRSWPGFHSERQWTVRDG